MALKVIKLDLSSIGLLGSTSFGKEEAELISKTIVKLCKTLVILFKKSNVRQ